MSLTGFTRLGSLTAPSVTGSASDLPTLVKYEDFTSTMLASLDAGGGDLRFSSDEAGTTQLACEVVTFTKATGDVVWVKVPSVSTSALIYVWGDNTGASQPAVGAGFGRNAVWSDFVAVAHLNDLVDSTGSGNTLVNTGATQVTSGKFGGGYSLNGSSNRLDADITINASPLTLSAWVQQDVLTADGMFASVARKNSTSLQQRAGVFGATASGSAVASTFDGALKDAETPTAALASTSEIVLVHACFDTSGRFVYYSGQNKGTGTGTSNITGIDRLSIGVSADATPVGWWDGVISEVWVRPYVMTDAQALIEYDNQSAVGAWWTATDEGGGGPVTQTLTPTAIASLETWGSPSVYNVLQILAASGIATGELWGAHAVSTTSGTSILQPSGVASLESWGTPVVTPLIVQLVATAISSLEAWGTPSVLSGVSVLTATGVSSEEAWGTVTLSNLKQYLLASGVISAEAWGNPVLEVLLKVLVAQSIASGEAWGLPLLSGGDALVVPVAYRQTYNDIAAFLRTQLIKGQDNEVILKWLSNEGYLGNFNEALDDYLRDLGKAGGLQDKFANWRDE